MTTIVGWGSSPWGSSSWGGPISGGGALALNAALAIRENVVRLSFNQPVYWSGILDLQDASDARRYALAPVSGTTGLDAEPARAVSVVSATLPTNAADGIAPADEGRFLDLTLDRPLSAEGALYDLTVTAVWSADLANFLASAALRVDGLYRRLVPPQVDVPLPARDFASIQAGAPGADDPPFAADAPELGTLRVDDTGDYAFDEGVASLRKRVLRRMFTRKGGFAHLPNYGVGIPQMGKRLAVSSVLAATAADAQAQIAREPDVAKVRVQAIADPSVPGLVRFRVAVRPKIGQPHRFDVTFQT